MRITLFALLALMSIPAHASFFTGNELVQYMHETEKADAQDPKTEYFDVGKYLGFVLGVFDAYESTGYICARKNVTIAQVSQVVSTYLKENPDKAKREAVRSVREALRAAYPCESNAPPP